MSTQNRIGVYSLYNYAHQTSTQTYDKIREDFYKRETFYDFLYSSEI